MKTSSKFLMLTMILALACERSASASDASVSRTQSANGAANTEPSRERQLAEFRAGSGPRVSQFSDASTTRDELVRRFATALEAGDTTALRRMTLSRAEFAWLYYAESPQSKPPYDLEPELMWEQIQTQSVRGRTRAVREYAGHLRYLRYECEATPMTAGAVRLYNGCRVIHQYEDRPLAEPLFGSIIERDRQFKFVGLSNRL